MTGQLPGRHGSGVITPAGLPPGCPPWFAHPDARTWTCAPTPTTEVKAFHAGLPGYAPTPLTEVPAIAAELAVGRVFVKDESARMGLPAFKVLGASWAVHQVLARRPATAALTLVTATDGNHGRALARMARLSGQRARVFVPSGVHPTAVAAIAAEGAQVTEITGTYHDAVRLAAEAADRPGATLVQDAGWPGYEQVPGWIVEGYSTLFAEVDEQLADAGAAEPALVVIPAGVGSLSQAGIIHYRSRPDSRRTALLTVEPGTAACVLASLVRGELGTIPVSETIMAGLNCGTPSMLAWPYLRDGLDAAVAVADAGSVTAARDLAGHGILAGPCGGAALAGAEAALTGEGAEGRRAALAVRPDATVVLLSTEGSAANPLPASEPDSRRPAPSGCGSVPSSASPATSSMISISRPASPAGRRGAPRQGCVIERAHSRLGSMGKLSTGAGTSAGLAAQRGTAMAADVTPATSRAADPVLEAASLEEASASLRAAGLVVGEISASRVTGHLQLGPQHHTPWGVVHGGVYTDRDRERREHRGEQRRPRSGPGRGRADQHHPLPAIACRGPGERRGDRPEPGPHPAALAGGHH